MNDTIIVAALSLLGTLFGSLGGIYAAAKLTTFRLEQLEKKVELHNNAVERLFIAEGDIKELKHDVVDLKGYHKPKS